MTVLEAIEDTSAIARIDPSAVTDAGLWVAPLLPTGRHEGYQPLAMLPNVAAGQWLGSAALGPLLADETTPSSATIELAQHIPEDLRKAMDDYPRSSIGSDGREDGTALVEMAALKRAASRIGGTLLGVALAQPGETTTTMTPLCSNFPNRGFKTGFHLDNRDEKTLLERTDSRRRFIPNGGPGMRMAAFCLPDIVTVAHILGYPDDLVPGYDIFREFLHKYPDRAVCIGIPVQPGQGSLINTDLYLHDGMTIGASEESMTLQILGNWERGELALVA